MTWWFWGQFLKDYDSFRVAISRTIANGVPDSGSSRSHSIATYFGSNKYSNGEDGLSKMAYFISKARFFCNNGVVNSRSNDGSFAIPPTGAVVQSNSQDHQDGDFKVANNIYNALLAMGLTNPTLLNWIVTNLTGQRDVDFFEPAFDATTTTVATLNSNNLGLSSAPQITSNSVTGTLFTSSLGTVTGTFVVSSNQQSTPQIAMTYQQQGIVPISTVSVVNQDIWLAGPSGTTITNSTSVYFLAPAAQMIDVAYANGYHSYFALWFSTVGFYLQSQQRLVTTTAPVPSGMNLQSSTAQASLTTYPSTSNYLNAFVQANSQVYSLPLPSVTNNVNNVQGYFSTAFGSSLATFIVVNTNGGLNQTPEIAMLYSGSSVISVTITTTQSIWLAGSSTSTVINASSIYFQCPSAVLVDVLYANGYHSYFGIWHSTTGFYLQGNACLTTATTTVPTPTSLDPATSNTHAFLASAVSTKSFSNAYVQANSQQYTLVNTGSGQIAIWNYTTSAISAGQITVGASAGNGVGTSSTCTYDKSQSINQIVGCSFPFSASSFYSPSIYANMIARCLVTEVDLTSGLAQPPLLTGSLVVQVMVQETDVNLPVTNFDLCFEFNANNSRFVHTGSTVLGSAPVSRFIGLPYGKQVPGPSGALQSITFNRPAHQQTTWCFENDISQVVNLVLFDSSWNALPCTPVNTITVASTPNTFAQLQAYGNLYGLPDFPTGASYFFVTVPNIHVPSNITDQKQNTANFIPIPTIATSGQYICCAQLSYVASVILTYTNSTGGISTLPMSNVQVLRVDTMVVGFGIASVYYAIWGYYDHFVLSISLGTNGILSSTALISYSAMQAYGFSGLT